MGATLKQSLRVQLGLDSIRTLNLTVECGTPDALLDGGTQ